jgi:hypothetical protein
METLKWDKNGDRKTRRDVLEADLRQYPGKGGREDTREVARKESNQGLL